MSEMYLKMLLFVFSV